MQKIQQILIGVLITFSAIGTGTLITHVGNFNIDRIKTEVTASGDTTPPPSDTIASTIAPPTTQTVTPEMAAPETAPTDPALIVQSEIPVTTPATDTILTPITSGLTISTESIEEKGEEKENESSTSIKKTKKHIMKGDITPQTDTKDSTLIDPSTSEPTTPSLDIPTSTPAEISPLPAAENISSLPAPEVKEITIATEQPKTESNTQNEEKVQSSSPENEKDKATREAMKNQPKINKKILETLKGMAMIPDLLVKLGVVVDDSENEGKLNSIYKKKEEEKKPETILDIFTSLIKELTSNLQENTIALEETIKYIYKQQGTDPASSGRCIQSTYFTYSDAENACMMISRKVCKTNEIVPDNRYETMESCKQDHGLIEQINESREASAFRKQKEEYLGRLKTLQDAYKYYSVKWEELVDLANDSTDFDTLGQAGNAINLYRTEQKEPEKQAASVSVQQSSAETVTTPDSILPQTQPVATAP